jgi:ERCC4-type nuclease
MNIRIDVREHDLLSKCQNTVAAVNNFKDLKFIVEQLPLGDIIINDGQNDIIIIERKTLSDLAASIKDGRYEEQSYRLNGIPHHNHNIIYLIEGDFNRFNTFRERIDKQTLYSAMVSIHYYKGFSVMRSSSIEETALIVCNMAFKLNKDKTKVAYYSNMSIHSPMTVLNNETQKETGANDDTEGNNNLETIGTVVSNNTSSEKDYCSVVKKVKKENVTPENIGEIMLCQIPGISSASALAILAEFKTLPNLIKRVNEDPCCLNSICTTDANGKSRKISKTSIATIIKYFTYTTNTSSVETVATFS